MGILRIINKNLIVRNLDIKQSQGVDRMRYRNLLDIAVGNHSHGLYTPFYAMANHIVGADIEKDVTGRHDVDRFDVVDCNLPLPYEDNEFEVVISEHTIEHLENPEVFYQEVQRVASNLAIVTTPHWLRDKLEKMPLFGVKSINKHPHVRQFNPKWFREHTDANKWIYQQKMSKDFFYLWNRIPVPFLLTSEIIVTLRARNSFR